MGREYAEYAYDCNDKIQCSGSAHAMTLKRWSFGREVSLLSTVGINQKAQQVFHVEHPSRATLTAKRRIECGPWRKPWEIARSKSSPEGATEPW
jgi:hypothetical protein